MAGTWKPENNPQASGTPNQHARSKNQGASQNYLQRGGNPWRFHEAMTHPCDRSQLSDHHNDGNHGGNAERWNQEGQSVADPAEHRHQSTNQPADPRMSTPGKAAVVREGLSKAHADAGAERSRKADHKCEMRFVPGKSRGKNRRQRRDRSIHQPSDPRLNDL